MRKVIRIRLGHKLALIRLLNIILIALLIGEIDSVFLALKRDALAVHEVRARLPAYERVLPAVALGEGVPVHEPVGRVPIAGLGCGFGWAVDTSVSMLVWCAERREEPEKYSYRTVRAWRSTGAPERTAAATDSPGSEPSITRFGIGENALCLQSAPHMPRISDWDALRCPVVGCNLVVGIVSCCALGRPFLSGHLRRIRSLCWRFCRGIRIPWSALVIVSCCSGECSHRRAP
jgi:hypothetical protein